MVARIVMWGRFVRIRGILELVPAFEGHQGLEIGVAVGPILKKLLNIC